VGRVIRRQMLRKFLLAAAFWSDSRVVGLSVAIYEQTDGIRLWADDDQQDKYVIIESQLDAYMEPQLLTGRSVEDKTQRAISKLSLLSPG
jgi:hypothetical protein